jgi:hypothetical protein
MSLSFCVYGTAIRSFQSVSPSNWSVRMKHAPDSSDVRRSTTSAGTRRFFSMIMRSPTSIRLKIGRIKKKSWKNIAIIQNSRKRKKNLRACHFHLSVSRNFVVSFTVQFSIPKVANEIVEGLPNQCDYQNEALTFGKLKNVHINFFC